MSKITRTKSELMQFSKYLSVLIKPTDTGNVRCKHCYEQHSGYNADKLSLENLQKFCQITFPHYDGINIILYGGEPTLLGVATLEEYVNLLKYYAKEYKVDVKYSIQSNGKLLNEDLVKFFKENKIEVRVSFDGLHNDYIFNSTDVLLKSKELLSKHGVDFEAIIVVSGINYRDLISNYEYMKKNKINMQLKHYTDADASDKSSIIPLDDYIVEMKKLFDYWINDAECNIKVNPFLKSIRDYCKGYSNSCAYSSCMRCWLCLTPNGDITPCNRTFPSEYIYGNVKSLNDIREIYKSKGFLNLMKKSNARKAKCKIECDLYNFCKSGCNYCAICEDGLENNKGFSCKAFYKIFSYIIKQGKRLGFFDDNIDFAVIKNPTIIKLLKDIHSKKTSAKNNIEGNTGIINKSGKLGDSSFLLKPKEENFWDNIEKGIKSTVKLLLDNGLKTYSSCQGHGAGYSHRFVSVVMEKEEKTGLLNFIFSLNKEKKYSKPIFYNILEAPSKNFIYQDDFKDPLIINIIFGVYYEKETLKKQKDFEECFDKSKLKNANTCYFDIYRYPGSHTDIHS